jgi:hypothetical protein
MSLSSGDGHFMSLDPATWAGFAIELGRRRLALKGD